MAKRRLTRTQASILRCMAENGGRAIIYTGFRRSKYHRGKALIFGQGLHAMLQNRWITSKGENERCSYVWTEEGRNAHRNGFYVPVQRGPHWQDAVKPEPAAHEVEMQELG
jgi:hypothetical protein